MTQSCIALKHQFVKTNMFGSKRYGDNVLCFVFEHNFILENKILIIIDHIPAKMSDISTKVCINTIMHTRNFKLSCSIKKDTYKYTKTHITRVFSHCSIHNLVILLASSFKLATKIDRMYTYLCEHYLVGHFMCNLFMSTKTSYNLKCSPITKPHSPMYKPKKKRNLVGKTDQKQV